MNAFVKGLTRPIDTFEKALVTHHRLGEFLILSMLAISALIIWFRPDKELGRVESIALAWAAIMMFWAAWGSRGVAMTSRDQIKEIRRQTQGFLMPAIEIQVLQLLGSTTNSPQSLLCKLNNIGPGPALNVTAQIYRPDGNHQFQDLGTALSGSFLTQQPLLVIERDGVLGVSVCCRDIYGRSCESRREISRDTATDVWTVGPLKVDCI